MTEILSTENLAIGYQGKVVSSGLNLNLKPGKLVCLIGANGCGKSTLLRTLAGLQEANSGEILLDGKSVDTVSPLEMAKHISLVLTDKPDTVNLRVRELVSLGRSPYTNWFGKLTKEDESKIQWALEQTHTAGLENRLVKTLSDGQKQRVMIAKALAQDTPILLLDEPTAHLDLPNRVAILQLLHQLAKESGKSILLSTHELDLALQLADELWLFDSNRQVHCDIPEALVLDNTLSMAFNSNQIQFSKETGQFELNKSIEKEIQLTGTGHNYYWTKKALERIGYSIIAKSDVKIEVKNNFWGYTNTKEVQEYNSLSEIINRLDYEH
jgi:iron complex transport system ATP-binding protein